MFESSQAKSLGHSEPAFVLDRLAHHVIAGQRDAARGLVLDALDRGVPAETLLAEMLWPVIECVEQLRADGLMGVRAFNGAARIVRSLTDVVSAGLPMLQMHGRSVEVICAPGQEDELAAHVCGELAEAHGWRVFFAGAGLTREELAFSVGQLSPDVLLVHAGAGVDGAGLEKWLMDLRVLKIWPSVQVVVTGSAVQKESRRWMADIVGRDPVEALELMGLCPEYRLERGTRGRALASMAGQTMYGTSAAALRRLVARYYAGDFRAETN